jgi:hypothetical protein
MITAVSPASFRHVPCGGDGSDEACRAADQAARMANGFDAGPSFLAIGEDAGRCEGFAG